METIDNSYDSEESEEVASAKIVKGPKCSRILDSDDEDCSTTISKIAVQNETGKNELVNEKMEVRESPSSDDEDEPESNFKKKSLIKKRHISDSESDADGDSAGNDNCSDNEVNVKEMNKTNKINQDHIDEPDSTFKKKFLDSDIYDAEGSSDEGQLKISDHEEEGNDLSKNKKKEKKDKAKRNNLQRKSKQTAIEEIRSETQRLVRQSRISLPYHRPKQRSLSEFLDRRKSLPVVPLKTSTDELSKVWEKIEEREKTAESFYKSESDVSDSEPCSVPLVKVSDDEINKLATDNEKLIQESSLELCLHYTETESQEIQNKTSQDIQIELPSNSEIKEGQLNQDITELSLKQVEITESKESSQSDSVIETDIEKIVCDVSSTSHINLFDKDNALALSVDENIRCNLVISNKESSEPSCSSEVTLKDDDDSKLEFENHSEITTASITGTKVLNRSNRLKPDVKLNKVPRLSGQPDEVIDLDKSPEKPGAVKLISRFMKHITLKPKIKVQENVVVAISEVNENGEIVNIKEETLEIKKKEESLKIKVNDTSKPGETRMKLKATLRNKIAQCREQQFAKRLEEYKLNEEEIYEEGGKPDYEEEVEELTATESESDSEIEDDVIMKDKVKEKNPFVDEEAEESENDEDGIENDAGSDADEYSDAPSVDLESLVDKDEELPNLENVLDGDSSQRNNELMALCSGVFTSQPINLNDLEQSDVSFTQVETKDTSFSPSKISEEPVSPPADIGKNYNEIASDNESDEDITIKKKRKSKLTFSDDEDDVDGENDDNENPDSPNVYEDSEKEDIANDSENEEIVLSGEDEEGDVVEFEDDEEAEYEKVTKKAAKRFLEAEAELSGSEWGSADEDEIDLDVMEKEEGDEDVLNQRQVRSELEKIHMKELLDEDKREIRALQELFLEDGELHSDGPKRQRQFRWYNQDGDNENNSFLTNLDGEFKDNGEEDEEDESWRKTRLERENFLRNQKNDDTEISDENVKFLKFAKKPVVKPPKPPQAKFTSPDPRKQFSLVSRRGSFLSRGEKLLTKLAELTNVSSDNPLGNVRGQRNMVFAVVSPPKEEPKDMPLKRKSTSNFAVSAPKKLKFSPPTGAKRHGGSLFEKLKMVD